MNVQDSKSSEPLKTEVLPTHTPELFRGAVRRAAALLCRGEIVALPTETVYGLAANALNAQAVATIFKIKGRPAHNPLIVHIAGYAMAKLCTRDFPKLAQNLGRAFWPGPLTLVLPRATIIPDEVTAGGNTVGVRWPAHPFIQALIRECDFPLAAPSANLSNRISPTNAEHVLAQLGGKIPLLVDGGQSQVGIESTVLDLTVSPPAILRPGMIHQQSIVAVGGEVTIAAESTRENGDAVARSPGLLKRHYSPNAKLVILRWEDETTLCSQLLEMQIDLSKACIIAHSCIPSGGHFAEVSVVPHDAEAFARALYGELHRCDQAGAKWIVVERPPESPEWAGVMDRLRRASA